MKKSILATFAFAALAFLPKSALAQEQQCDNGIDDDGDSVYDCGDNDCASDPVCKPDGQPENSDQRCTDWIDNDGDGQLDCDDSDCFAVGIYACEGSYDTMKRVAKSGGTATAATPGGNDIPELGAGMSVEDLIGVGSDNDGERNDVACSDGIDNDADGRTDCADFGCRFDPTVTVCQGDPDFRFSVVARGAQTYEFEEKVKNTKVDTLQLRAFGPMPLVNDSFFLLSMRADKTPRLTFAMFQVPLGKNGHYLNLNSGGGGLSIELIRSAHKRLLLDSAFYLYNAFEQGNGAAIEVGGPIDANGKFLYRAFAAGGTGRFSGNVGGGYVSDDNNNYTYTTGGQIHMNLIGYHSRWDSSMLFVKAPLTLSAAIGMKYDQRAQERYPALNINAILKWKNFILVGETYAKQEIDFKSRHMAYNLKVGVLAIPKKLMLAVDFGEFLELKAGEYPGDVPNDIASQRQETQIRAAAHYYLWRNIVVGTLLFADRKVDPAPGQTEQVHSREAKAVMSYRF
ncbi:MAG: hypothetical protein GY811_00890 [Myxococcales bacterium]|nr:hypothetical protein [Myxococcales bacterium]